MIVTVSLMKSLRLTKKYIDLDDDGFGGPSSNVHNLMVLLQMMTIVTMF